MPQKPTEQEKLDLNSLQNEIKSIKCNCYDALLAAERTPEDQLKHRGYKTADEMFKGTFRYYKAKIDELIKNHLKKYPD